MVSTAPTVVEALGVLPYMSSDEQADATPEDRLWANNERLTALIDRLGIGLEHLDQFPEGYAGVVFDDVDLEVNLWWVGGTLPDETTAVLRREFPDLAVTVHDATHSRLDLVRARDQIQAHPAGDLVNLIYPRQDGSALVLTHDPGVVVDTESLARAAGIPIITTVQTVGEYAVRHTDDAPFKGGALYRNESTDEFCSTGFAVRTSSGDGRILGAAHCGRTAADGWGAPLAIRATGNVLHDTLAFASQLQFLPQFDAMLMNPAGNTAGYVYYGGPAAPSSTARPVTGQQNTYLQAGNSIASSGANSGLHVGRLFGNGWQQPCNGNPCILAYARANAGQAIMGAAGDSGGPMILGRSDGGVWAVGILRGPANGPAELDDDELTNAQCIATGIPFAIVTHMNVNDNAIRCSVGIMYVPLIPILDTWGLSVQHYTQTGP